MTEGTDFGGPSASRRSVMRAIPFVLGGLAIGRRWGLARANDDLGPDVAAAGVPMESAFPLALKPGKRYLVDADGKPFLIHGDTAWSLIVQLTREEVELYLDDRRARGFNTILVSLIDRAYSLNPPSNAYGEPPFLEPENYATPNGAYFRHADWVLRRAAERGFLVLLTPSYVGCCEDGWYRAMVANGPDRLRRYGRYVGRRYRNFTNILWVHSGDFNIPEKELVNAIAEGIRELDPQALHTAHGLQTAARDYWPDESWLQVNNVYTYGPVHIPALAQYARPEVMPFFLIESAYENEHAATEQRLRTQAYQAILCGASGQIFGNNPIWHFDWPTGRQAVTWQEALESRGAQSMSHLRNLLIDLRWWKLRPDQNNRLLISGHGEDNDRAVAARSVDRSFALLYLPSNREVTVDLSRLAGPRVKAHWFDPADGRFSRVEGAPFGATKTRRFRPESTNSAGFGDWVLRLESRP
jgi:hypothetical protein